MRNAPAFLGCISWLEKCPCISSATLMHRFAYYTLAQFSMTAVKAEDVPGLRACFCFTCDLLKIMEDQRQLPQLVSKAVVTIGVTTGVNVPTYDRCR